MATLILIRGLPGAGKTTLAVAMDGTVISADDWMINDKGDYHFDSAHLPYCHRRCQSATADALGMGKSVIVANTFSQAWELAPYLKIARTCGANAGITDLFDAGLTDAELAARNVHGVPVATIAAMRARWEK